MEARLKELYHSINTRGRQQISAHQEEIDRQLQARQPDQRRGLTLLGHLPAHVSRNIDFTLQQVAMVAPGQYYYPAPNRHITVMDLLAARPDFQLLQERFAEYQAVVAKIVAQTAPIHWQMKGLIVSPGAILVAGDYGSELAALRQRLRTELPAHGLPVAERYPTISGHVTVARFTRRLTDPAGLLAVVKDNATVNYGSFTMPSLDLVVHDWYNHQVDRAVRLPFAGYGR